ncbi:MAG: hypothetical protein OEY11_11805 [Gammaproteobacteria bacterium]|nr:hypothetical protein [Gammaproteobacteria bacterium]
MSLLNQALKIFFRKRFLLLDIRANAIQIDNSLLFYLCQSHFFNLAFISINKK